MQQQKKDQQRQGGSGQSRQNPGRRTGGQSQTGTRDREEDRDVDQE